METKQCKQNKMETKYKFFLEINQKIKFGNKAKKNGKKVRKKKKKSKKKRKQSKNPN